MENCLKKLEVATLNGLLMVKAETYKLTKIKINTLLGVVQMFFEKPKIKNEKYLNTHSEINIIYQNQTNDFLEKIHQDLIFEVKSKENTFSQAIKRLFERNLELYESYFDEMSAELMKTIKNNMIINPSYYITKPYASNCNTSYECKSELNLYCSTIGNLCNCPTSLGAGTCDCKDTQYYETKIGCGKL